jgi:hypothetical protein
MTCMKYNVLLHNTIIFAQIFFFRATLYISQNSDRGLSEHVTKKRTKFLAHKLAER